MSDALGQPAATNEASLHRPGAILPVPKFKGPGLVIALVLLLQLWSRYLPNPWAVLVADDWSNWARSLLYETNLDAMMAGLQDPNRPLSMLAVEVAFRIFGNEPLYWTLVSVAANSMLIFCLMKMAWGLTGKRSVVLISGVIFAVLPSLTETYHWSTQVLNEVACALMLYAFSGWMWIDHVRRGGTGRLVLSAAAYLFALFSYEAGILLPAAYVVLLPWRQAPARSLARLSVFGSVAVLYVAWRVTDAFGMNQTWYYPPHMEAGISLAGVLWNLREVMHWSVGDHFFGTILNGLASFSDLSTWMRRVLVVGNVVVIGVVGLAIKHSSLPKFDETAPFSTGRAVLFVLIWTGAAFAIPALSYTAARLMVLPAVGLAIGLAVVLAQRPVSSWGPWLYVPVVLCVMSNQGTTESYRQAGELNRKLFAHITDSVDEWRDKDVVLLDTSGIRHRLTPGLLAPPSMATSTWADYRNALLLRGFVVSGMLQVVSPESIQGLMVVHDAECNALRQADTLLWHERFDPSQPHRTPMDRVYSIDVGTVLWENE